MSAARRLRKATMEVRRGIEPGADAFGQRQIADLLGEATRRTILGNVRPLWADIPEAEKAPWRQAGLDAMRHYCRQVKRNREQAGRER